MCQALVFWGGFHTRSCAHLCHAHTSSPAAGLIPLPQTTGVLPWGSRDKMGPGGVRLMSLLSYGQPVLAT